MKRVSGVVVAFLMGAAAIVGLPSPASAGVVVDPGTTMMVTARPWTDHYNDVGPKGESIGDSIVFTDKLYQHGERVGRDAIRCDVKRVTRRSFSMQCFGSLVFRGRGQLTVQGLITFSRNSTRNPVLAVTGGTGEFEGMSGEFTVIERRGSENTRYRIHLLPA